MSEAEGRRRAWPIGWARRMSRLGTACCGAIAAMLLVSVGCERDQSNQREAARGEAWPPKAAAMPPRTAAMPSDATAISSDAADARPGAGATTSASAAMTPGGAIKRRSVAAAPLKAVSLGNMRLSSSGVDATLSLASIVLGVSPLAPPMELAKPIHVRAAADGDLYIIDAARASLVRWNASDEALLRLDLPAERADGSPSEFQSVKGHPIACALAPDGSVIVAAVGDAGGVVVGIDGNGEILRRYQAIGDFKPAGTACVGNEVWVSNIALHRIEVFELSSGRALRSIGGRGDRSGEFRFPMGLATTPDDQVCVVDSMNSRVQVLSREGRWIQTIGRAGDCDGCFSRPRDVCVGPDGTIFVTDAAAARVQAFDRDGALLAVFGADSSESHHESGGIVGIADRDRAGGRRLVAPAGVTIVSNPPAGAEALPDGFAARYYVLVAERLSQPGLRTYAWGTGRDERSLAGAARARPEDLAPLVEGVERAINPHWSAARCSACHAAEDGPPRSIPIAQADQVCLSCHDGRKAHDEPHPTGRLARTAAVTTPEDWPTDAGRLSCLTCHDISQHCSQEPRRPFENAVMLRGFETQRADSYCNTCHVADESWRFSPHRQVAADGTVNKSVCLFCHTDAIDVPADGVRRGSAMLRTESSQGCRACHVKHWDVSERGHVDRPMTAEIRRLLEASGAAGQSASARPALLLPLGNDRVTCYTCHNPHQRELFPAGTPLGQQSDAPADAHAALRVNSATLCLECHKK